MNIQNVPDLMTFLKEEFLNTQTEQVLPHQAASIDLFVDFARKYLAEDNQPINIAYLNAGVGLRLQQGQTVCFKPQADSSDMQPDSSVRITRPKTIPGMHGITNTQGFGIIAKN